jgi:hypothetical protein
MSGKRPPRELHAKLQDDLAAALTVYLDPHELTARPGLIAALGAISKFIENIPELEEQRLSLPFRALSVALDALDSGYVYEFLRKRAVWDRHPYPFERQKVMLAGALALEHEALETGDLLTSR